jgi:hypothetical protein
MSTRAAGRSESGGRVKARFTMDLQSGAVRQLSDRMLILLLKARLRPAPLSAFGGEAVAQRAEIRGQRSDEISENPESACDFVPQDVGVELLTMGDCPEIDGKAKG